MRILWPDADTIIADDVDVTMQPLAGGWLGPDYRELIQSEALTRAAILTRFPRGNADLSVRGRVQRVFATAPERAAFERIVCDEPDIEGTLRFREADGSTTSLVAFPALLESVRVLQSFGVVCELEYTFHITGFPTVEDDSATTDIYDCTQRSTATTLLLAAFDADARSTTDTYDFSHS